MEVIIADEDGKFNCFLSRERIPAAGETGVMGFDQNTEANLRVQNGEPDKKEISSGENKMNPLECCGNGNKNECCAL